MEQQIPIIGLVQTSLYQEEAAYDSEASRSYESRRSGAPQPLFFPICKLIRMFHVHSWGLQSRRGWMLPSGSLYCAILKTQSFQNTTVLHMKIRMLFCQCPFNLNWIMEIALCIFRLNSFSRGIIIRRISMNLKNLTRVILVCFHCKKQPKASY